MPTQLTLDLGDAPRLSATSGLPEMTGPERVRAELEVLGLDASGHVVDFYAPMLDALGVTRARDLLTGRSGREVLVAGVKVATQTPPIRSGRRVVFLTLDDATGPVDLTFFEDVQGPYAATVFHSWLLLCRGVVRRTGPRGVSIRATGAWEMSALQRGLDVRGRGRGAGGACRGRPRGVGAGSRSRRGQARHRSEWVRAPRGAGCSSTPPASSSRPTPTSSRRARRSRAPGEPARSCPTPAPRGSAAQAVAREPRKLGALGWTGTRTNRQGGPRARRAAPPETRRGPALGGRLLRGRPRGRDVGRARDALSRCSTSVAAPAGSPCRSARPGTTSRWSTPAPTRSPHCAAAPASPASRTTSSASRATATRSPRCSATVRSTSSAATARSRSSTTRPRPCVPPLPPCVPAAGSRCSSPGRLAVVFAKAIAGEFGQARAALTDPSGRWGSTDPLPRRFDVDQLEALLAEAGFTDVNVRGTGILGHLVPAAHIDSEADRAALAELDELLVTGPGREFLRTLGNGLHVLARRD